jgi:hypothetical protein
MILLHRSNLRLFIPCINVLESFSKTLPFKHFNNANKNVLPGKKRVKIGNAFKDYRC